MTTPGTLSNYAETAITNNFFRNTGYSTPVNTYCALYTTNPTDADIGNEVSTIGTGYARQPVTWSAPAVTSVPGVFENKYAIRNTTDIVFPTAQADWGLVTHWGIRDANTAGNLLAYGEVEVAANVTTTNEYMFTAANTVLFWDLNPFSNSVAIAALNLIFRNTPQVPTPLYVALYSTDPTGSDVGVEVPSVGTGYARQVVAFGTVTQDGSGRAVIKNTSPIEFPVATGAYPPVTHIGIRSAATGGTLLLTAPATQVVALKPTEVYKIAVDNLIFGIN